MMKRRRLKERRRRSAACNTSVSSTAASTATGSSWWSSREEAAFIIFTAVVFMSVLITLQQTPALATTLVSAATAAFVVKNASLSRRTKFRGSSTVPRPLTTPAFLPPPPPPSSSKSSQLRMASRPVDLDVSFGSEKKGNSGGKNQTTTISGSTTLEVGGMVFGGERAGSEEEFDEGEMNALESSGSRTRDGHEDRVAELLEGSDLEFREQRKQNKWGKFANVTSKQDMQAVLEKERAKLEQKQQLLAQMALESGVEYSVLDPKEETDNDLYGFDDDITGSGNLRIKAGSSSAGGSGRSWFADMDQELAEEWKALTEEDSDATAADSDADEEEGEEEGKDDTDTESSAAGDSDIVRRKSDGKIVVREEALSGVRIGSAGGWSLEVFPGDYVVHRKYGIGKFESTKLRPKTRLSQEEKEARDARRAEILTQELRQMNRSVTADEIQAIRSKFGTSDDIDPVSNPQTTVLEITYADALVHVPVDRAYRLSRYRAGNALIKPRLSRVKGGAWRKARQKVEATTLELAQDVLALYATRETLKRHPFDPVLESNVKNFEKTFPYTPTSDQLSAFEQVENDMVWRSQPMDRLICGDVGFGKTEVAMRALYRCILNGKQAAMLAPTGVLAAQHYRNLVSRLNDFNITVTLLRGGMNKNTKTGRQIRETITDGSAQLIVGTHALLSNDIKFHNLGLLVVDEEQRFGVKQKERLKLICNGVDVLTLSATPIPRTLQMSLSGIRDTSTIRSPPPMRKPTKTYVQEYNEDIIKYSIQTELARGGQCYYVVPRISMLQEAHDTVLRLFPGIRIIEAHGRMHRNGAEENVATFAEGNYDVLLATTVIENGVDIPTVNTIIVENAQSFGMSTLYQLRGRVGRSDKQAYAYFLHRSEKTTEQAAMRLNAIADLHELGSGFDVANRDLEIRGAGSLLGTEQSGLASKVGFDLYMRMLKKSIRKLRGLDLPFVPRTNMLLPKKVMTNTPDTFRIPDSYIPDNDTRKQEETKARLADSTASLVNITNEWKEDYGNMPANLQQQLKIMHLHACTRRLGIDLVGLVSANKEDETKLSCVMRSPGLRPRHWAAIAKALPRAALKGIDVCFPSRFSVSGEKETEIKGGSAIDLKALLEDETLSSSYDNDDNEEWDEAMDQEELEAMKEISSAYKVTDMSEIDLEQYPRLVIPNFVATDTKTVDRLLKVLLPIAKVVYEIQHEQAESAKTATELRERQELLRIRRKRNVKTY